MNIHEDELLKQIITTRRLHNPEYIAFAGPLAEGTTGEALNLIWGSLEMIREDCISPDNGGFNDDRWDDICFAMAWIEADLKEVRDE